MSSYRQYVSHAKTTTKSAPSKPKKPALAPANQKSILQPSKPLLDKPLLDKPNSSQAPSQAGKHTSPSTKKNEKKSGPATTKPKQTPARNKNAPSRFLTKLPGEIRNRIYAHAVGHVLVADQSYRFWTTNDEASKLGLPRNFPTVHWEGTTALTQQIAGGPGGGGALWPLDIPNSLAEELQHVLETGRSYPSDPVKVVRYKFGPQNLSILGHDVSRAGVQLLFVCKQVHFEALSLVYASATFAFGSLKSIRKMLIGHEYSVDREFEIMKMPPRAKPFYLNKLSFITSISLDCIAYGPPDATLDVYWQQRYYACWHLTCCEIVFSLPRLEHLRLSISVPRENSVRLRLNDRWLAPFLQFSGCEKLKNVEVFFLPTCGRLDPQLLEVFGEVVRRSILGFDFESALEAITHAISLESLHENDESLAKSLASMGRANGMKIEG